MRDQQHQVDADQHDDDERRDQHVHRVEGGDDVAGKLTAEHEERQPGSDDRDAEDDAVNDAQARAGEHVIGQGITGPAADQTQDEDQEDDHPAQAARLSERAGEEHAQQVHADRREQQQRSPVVSLPHEEPAPHFEGDVKRRVEGPRHVDARERGVRAAVGDDSARWVEEEHEEYAREQHDHEAVERHLGEHERPVGRHRAVPQFSGDSSGGGTLEGVGQAIGQLGTADVRTTGGGHQALQSEPIACFSTSHRREPLRQERRVSTSRSH